ncbi:MAG: tRNA (adenosine(37)-N6)-threonylcarbamoyltransferase complex dimerization subunit type 1 TsaB [Actinocrinis sp.]
MLLLAFDTATPAVTVALHDGTRILAELTEVDARRHGELLAPGIAKVLAAAGRDRRELTDLAVGVGPGPFTGLRVGLVTARALGDALGVAVHGVCTLDILAWAVRHDGPFAVATDARRREVYWARYEAPDRRVTEPAVDWPHVVAPQLDGLPVAGEGAVKYPESFPAPLAPQLPSAADLAELTVRRLAAAKGAADTRLLPPEPLYLRRPDAVEPGARKPVSQPALR